MAKNSQKPAEKFRKFKKNGPKIKLPENDENVKKK